MAAVTSRLLAAISKPYPDYDAVLPDDLVMLDAIGSEVEAGKPCPIDDAVSGARTLMGCYRARDFLDPEIFTTALVATLTRYSVHVVRLTCCPVHGLPSSAKFAPAIAEVREHLDKISGHLKAQAFMSRKALAMQAKNAD